MRKPFVLALLAYVVPTFIAGFAWHLVIFHETYAQLKVYRPDVIIPFGLGSMLVQGLFFAWAYPRLFGTGKTRWRLNALRAGLAFAAVSWSFTTFAAAAKQPMTSVELYLLMETGYTLVQFALVAPLMALAYRRESPPSHATPV